MSANNQIIIDKTTFKVYHNSCIDNDYKELIGKGKNLDEAVGIADKFIKEELGGGLYLEYGIRFI